MIQMLLGHQNLDNIARPHVATKVPHEVKGLLECLDLTSKT